MTQSELALRLRALFAEELDEQLLAGNEHLLALEQRPSDAEQLRSLFRVMHTLKGAARAAGFPELERECHVLESILASARDRSRPLSSDEVKALFEGLDRLAVAGASLRGGQAAGATSIAEVSTRDDAGHVTPTPVVVPIVQAPSMEAAVADAPQDMSIRVAQDRVDELFTISNRLLVLSAAVEAQPEEVSSGLPMNRCGRSTAWRRLRRALPVHTADSPIAREIDAMDALLESVRKSSASLLGGSLRTGRDLGRLSREVSRAARELRMRPFGDVVGDLPRPRSRPSPQRPAKKWR